MVALRSKAKLLLIEFAVVAAILCNLTSAFADEASAVSTFERFNATDIATAHIALKNGDSDVVKNLAQMIISDHEPIQQAVSRLVKSAGIKQNVSDIAPEYAQTVTRLKTLKGSDFDQTYIDHELPFSKHFIRTLKEKIIPSITTAELKRYFENLVPKFEEHLMHIEHSAMQLKAGEHNMQHGMHLSK